MLRISFLKLEIISEAFIMVSQSLNQVFGSTSKSNIVLDTFTNFGRVALVIFLKIVLYQLLAYRDCNFTN